MLNSIGLNTSSFGNHEFDQGRADIDGRVLPAANWEYTAANLYEADGVTPAYPGYYRQEFVGVDPAKPVSVAFIGAVTEELPSLVSPAGIETLVVGDIVDSVNRVVTDLSDGVGEQADVMILLIHEGATTTSVSSVTDDSVFGQIVAGVDVDGIVSAHTHLPYDHEVPIGPDAQLGPVISTGQYGERYGHMNLQVDPDTKEITLFDAEVLDLYDKFPADPDVAAIVSVGGQLSRSSSAACRSATSPRTSTALSWLRARRTAAVSRPSATSSPTCSSGPARTGRRRIRTAACRCSRS